jgi:transposase InsO family protein
VEGFNGKARDELFAWEIFDSVLEARVLYPDWRHAYYLHRPHRSLGLQPPAVFAAAFNNQKLSPALDWQNGDPSTSLISRLVAW